MLKEIQMDLFTADREYVLAHCISQDCKMGAGIAMQFKKRFPAMKRELLQRSPRVGDALLYAGEEMSAGGPIGERLVFNLITKRFYWGKPTYETLAASLLSMKKQMEERGITKLAIPQIGCGLDRLDWGRVGRQVENLFRDSGVDILVCVWK